jgi:hypothetical protein
MKMTDIQIPADEDIFKHTLAEWRALFSRADATRDDVAGFAVYWRYRIEQALEAKAK